MESREVDYMSDASSDSEHEFQVWYIVWIVHVEVCESCDYHMTFV